MPTAVLIDGAYFIKRFRYIEPHNSYDAKRASEQAFRWAVAHLVEGRTNGQQRKHELYRIFFYDCPPIANKLHNPITKKLVDFSKSKEALFRLELHELLRQKRKVALRLGHLAGDAQWTLKGPVVQELLKGKKKLDDVSESDVIPSVRQKGVDMRIGIDIASLSIKKQVDQIVLIAGDADFVPAAKLARREGVDFVLDPMWQSIPAGLNEHIDGLRSTCPMPQRRVAQAAPAAGVAQQANPV
ncbi:NYN domain-containing protein [Burkholderia arboris]|uniref:NYN domain-containing protein n=1 Tax=Burkholderia arboris TaxID=488730 RepID=UPI00210E4B0A|nr:NYN domain-containing protein [Burkholderia arboris]UTV55186.1 NYN domain-containing protein [Burkholderia arboris]